MQLLGGPSVPSAENSWASHTVKFGWALERHKWMALKPNGVAESTLGPQADYQQFGVPVDSGILSSY